MNAGDELDRAVARIQQADADRESQARQHANRARRLEEERRDLALAFTQRARAAGIAPSEIWVLEGHRDRRFREGREEIVSKARAWRIEIWPAGAESSAQYGYVLEDGRIMAEGHISKKSKRGAIYYGSPPLSEYVRDGIAKRLSAR